MDSGVPIEFVFSSKKIYKANENRNLLNSAPLEKFFLFMVIYTVIFLCLKIPKIVVNPMDFPKEFIESSKSDTKLVLL